MYYNYKFNFTIFGKINDNNFEDITINHNFIMNEITKPCDCTFKIEKGQNANLNCVLNIEEFKSIKIFTFNTTEIDFYHYYILSFPDLKIILKRKK